jgi:hypothetical protein
MKEQKKVIKLTKITGHDKGVFKTTPVLIGVESIIQVAEEEYTNYTSSHKMFCRKITSREAMATTIYVIETIDEIWKQINS